MKLGVIILFFNAERTILRCIDNCAPYVDVIYVSYSKKPWSVYNPVARVTYNNNSDLSILRNSNNFHKIKILEGEWETDEDQRNEVLELAKLDGVDYLIVQDADEFYFPSEYKKNLDGIRQAPNYPYYYNPWINFWKNLEYIVLERKNILGTEKSIYSDSANFAINLNYSSDICFSYSRQPNYPNDSALRLPGVCYHLSYVYTDEDVKRKISTWGHSHQVQHKWFEYKWLGWTPGSRFINPMMGPVWHKAIKFEGVLPEELKDFPELDQAHVPLTGFKKILEFFYDLNQLRRYTIHQMKGWLARKLKLGQYRKRL